MMPSAVVSHSFAEPLPKRVLNHRIGLPIKLSTALSGRAPMSAAEWIDPSFVPCSLSGSRSEILRPFSSSSLPPSLVSGRCTALSSAPRVDIPARRGAP